MTARPAPAFGWDFGGHLFFRVAGPLYLGGLFDYSISGPNALLAAGGVRLALGSAALSAGAGYTTLTSGGLGALGAIDFGVSSGFSLRLQGSWRRASATATVIGEDTTTVTSLMGGLSLQF